ncbi:retrotransposon protein, putative, ty1-copia subclass, partial [Tanacetum coccineum]
MKHLSEDGSLFQSPSATAQAYISTRNHKCHEYLVSLVQKCPDGVEDKLPFLERPIPVVLVPPAGQAEQELLQTVREFHVCKLEEGLSVSSNVLRTMSYIKNLERSHPMSLNLAVTLILVSLSKEYDSFMQNYNMHDIRTTVNELHAMLKLHEQTLPKKYAAPALHAIRVGRIQKNNHKNKKLQMASNRNNQRKGKTNFAYAPKPKIPPSSKKDNPVKDAICHQCDEVGHWRRNCPYYFSELMKKKKLSQGASTSGIFTIELYSFPSKSWVYDKGCGTHICNTTQGLRGSKKLKPGALNLYVGNGHRAAVEAIRNFHLCLQSGLVVVLNNCNFAPSITRGIISVLRLYDDGFVNRFFTCASWKKTLLKKDTTPALHAIRAGRVQNKNHKNKKPQLATRCNNQGKGKTKFAYAPKPNIPPPPKKDNPSKDAICHQCSDVGHWRRNCPHYLTELMNNKNLCQGASTSGSPGKTALLNGISISKDGLLYFHAIPRDGIYEIDLSNSNTNDSSMYDVSNKRAKLNLDSTLLWNCHLGYISKKRIKKLQHDGLLNSTDIESFNNCVSCLSGKMACKPYLHQVERTKDLLGLIHTDVCGPFRIVSRQGASYFVTFTKNFSRYDYVYLLRHKHEVFETFKVFQKEVENQLGKTIKSLSSDRGDEYMSQEFLDHLKEYGIIDHHTPPYTPQHNGVSERRNRTQLDMAEKTPYKVWHGQAPKLSYLKVWGCKALVKHDTLTKPDQLEPRSIKSIRTRNVPDHMCLYIDAKEHELGDLNKPANYKAALLGPESDKWLAAMNAKMQSIKDNQVWDLVDLPPNSKTVGSKWLFKKKIVMDGL